MSVKDKINYVKKELSNDEKVLEGALKIETLYKKYKFLIWGIVVISILLFAGKATIDALEEAKLAKANEAFLTLQIKADDKEALGVLKEKNPALFELFSYAQASKNQDIESLATLSSSSNSIILDASKYAVATLKKEPFASKLYKEMALFNEAYLAIKSGNIKKGQEKLTMIDQRSPLSMVTSLLNHSTLKAK